MMELSALTAQLRSEGVNISLKPNYKKYYKHYPHIIRFNYPVGRKNWDAVRSLHRRTANLVYDKVVSADFRTRSEYYTFNIYCKNIKSVLDAIDVETLKKWATIDVGEMANEVQEESNVKPELPKAQTTVVKRLPHGTWRYRIHWQPGHRFTNKIGLEALGAIVDQINNDPHTKHFDERTTQRLKSGNFWGTSYFYTNNTDVLCLIMLISPLFIKKIEKFTTLEELNEKAAS